MKIIIWIKNVLILVLSVLFLTIGINTLVISFKLNNPMEFVMYFFSASLLILVCLVGIIYFVFRFFPQKKENGIDDVKAE
jgi:H+/Cl- antiporter ClcA